MQHFHKNLIFFKKFENFGLNWNFSLIFCEIYCISLRRPGALPSELLRGFPTYRPAPVGLDTPENIPSGAPDNFLPIMLLMTYRLIEIRL